LVIIGVAGYVFIQQQKEVEKQQQAQIKRQQEYERRVSEMKADLIAEYQQRLKSIEEKTAATEEEKKAQYEEIERLKTWRSEQEQERLRLLKERQEAVARLERERKQREIREAAKKAKPETTKPKETVVVAKPENKPPVEQQDIKPEVKSLNIGDIIPLDSVTFAPSKLSGRRNFKSSDLTLSNSVLTKYGGQNLTIVSDILVNEFGSVTETKIKGELLSDLQTAVSKILKTWKYIPAEKDKVKVKVWMPAKMTIAFEGKPPKAVEAPKITAPVPLASTTYKPSKISGRNKLTEDSLKLSDSVRKKYAGKTLNVNASLLINELGNVIDVKITSNVPTEMKLKLAEVLETWTYTPAEKDKVKVKVWLPTDLTVVFMGATPPKVVIPIPKTLTPLKDVSYRPSKMSGSSKLKASDLKLSGAVRKQYKGQTISINANILINELGSIIKADIKGDWPGELKTKAAEYFKSWKYIPAEKDKVKVAVWLPVRISVSF
jgi:hypothetical protein